MPSILILAIPVLVCGASPADVHQARDVVPPVPVHATLPAVPSLPVETTSLEELYRGGQEWTAFLAGVDRRRDVWDESVRLAAVPDALAVRARSVGGTWRVLVITAAGCSDSANSVPYIVKLVQQTPGMEVRLVTADAGRPWMDAHRTPDGRGATPTVLLLDDSYRIRGCWVEQPAALQAWWLPALADGTASRRFSDKMAWYRDDAGRETLGEFVAVMEAAVAGRPICPGLAP
jgi:hypothetical protein